VRLQGWGRGARRVVEGDEEALGDAGGPVHRARPGRLHPPASMIHCLPSPQQQNGEEIQGRGVDGSRRFFLFCIEKREKAAFELHFGRWI
jgi:hypothetical protein